MAVRGKGCEIEAGRNAHAPRQWTDDLGRCRSRRRLLTKSKTQGATTPRLETSSRRFDPTPVPAGHGQGGVGNERSGGGGGDIFIGDGIVVATPFGSTAYYRSITDSFFEVGIGLAFNNSIEQSDHMVLRESTNISMKIIRGPALVYADNQETALEVGTHGTIEIRTSADTARLVVPL